MAGPTEPPHDADEELSRIWLLWAALMFTPREHAVMRAYYIKNLPPKEAARKLKMSPRTFRFHFANAKRKLCKNLPLFGS